MYDDARLSAIAASQTKSPAPAALLSEMMGALSETCCAPDEVAPEDVLHGAMAYSMALRGKRARGLLVLLVADAYKSDWRDALVLAHAVEMVHTASLIIDDLPSMDNAATRRGEPTNHVKYGEATAILAGIALLSEALVLLARAPGLSDGQRAAAVACLGSSVGLEGMTDGQQRDLFPVGRSIAHIDLTHARKTGALFAAATELGAIAAGKTGRERAHMSKFGMLLGKAFQGFDDLLDVACTTEALGKDTGKDVGKPTFVACLGYDQADQRAVAQINEALGCLQASGTATVGLVGFVQELSNQMRKRSDG